MQIPITVILYLTRRVDFKRQGEQLFFGEMLFFVHGSHRCTVQIGDIDLSLIRNVMNNFKITVPTTAESNSSTNACQRSSDRVRKNVTTVFFCVF